MRKMLPQLWMLVAVWLIPIIAVVECSWGSPGSSQYHIQTDEGPERYFRFQTDNGQFRKEKRLQDGTVIGTEAWIDAAGYLRQKDYIADKNGYRILKSKTIFVGQNRPIEEAIKAAKSAPAQAGILVGGSRRARPNQNAIHSGSAKHGGYAYSTTPLPTISTTLSTPSSTPATRPFSSAAAEGKLNYLSPAQAAQIQPSPYLGFDHYPDELPRQQAYLAHARQPSVYIRPHSEPLEEESDINSLNSISHNDFHSTTSRPTYASPPPLALEAPYESDAYRRRLRPLAVVPVTPAPIRGSGYSTPSPFSAQSGYAYTPVSSTPSPVASYDLNNLDGGLLPPLPPTSSHTRRLRPVASNGLEYDGVSATQNGFRYFLPRQYHEEENFEGDKRAGSYGYIDPFGIRRVVYYNASPGSGFVHRNNNRYVGLAATPYDPPGPTQTDV